MPPVFNIKKLTCSYLPDQPVLKIDELTIEKGKLVFILGVSGIGKSTFIETLGLMNQTIVNTSDTEVSFYPKETAIEMKDSWAKSNDEMAFFRNQHFSFIFQNTNLMPNFTAGENMCISQLIKGKTIVEAKPKVEEIMAELNLPAEVFDKKITELSGGQRQRLAFVRAITADFSVLFGDEPTGNLDQDTAFRLMNMLKKNLQKHQSTGIIVSHDIDLSIAFADQIILLTPHETHKYGVIDLEKIIYRTNNKFHNYDHTSIVDPKQIIFNTLNIEA